MLSPLRAWSRTWGTSWGCPPCWPCAAPSPWPAIQYSTVQYSKVQYSTVQYSTVQYSTVQYSTDQVSSCSVTIICQLATIHSKLSPTRLLLLLLGIVDVLKYPFLAPLSLIRWSWCMHAQQNLHSEARGWLYTNPIRWCRTRVQWPEPSAYIITEMNSLLLWALSTGLDSLFKIDIFWISLQSISF